jgi:hypothetical protein
LKIKIYTPVWDEASYNNSQDLKAYPGADVTVYDVRGTQSPRFYGHVYNAMCDFASTPNENRIFVFNSGDALAANNDHSPFLDKVQAVLGSNPDAWLMAPLFDQEPYGDQGNAISYLAETTIPGMNVAINANSIYVAMSRELVVHVLDFLDFMIDRYTLNYPEMYSGWSLDYVYSALTFNYDKIIYRGPAGFIHPGTALPHDQLQTEFAEGAKVLDELFAYYAQYGLDAERLQRVIDAINLKSGDSNNVIRIAPGDLYANQPESF